MSTHFPPCFLKCVQRGLWVIEGSEGYVWSILQNRQNEGRETKAAFQVLQIEMAFSSAWWRRSRDLQPFNAESTSLQASEGLDYEGHSLLFEKHPKFLTQSFQNDRGEDDFSAYKNIAELL